MSAQFKPGDRVRCIDVTGQPSEHLKLDDTALYTVASITQHGWLTLTSNPGPWLPSRFVKVDFESAGSDAPEPEDTDDVEPEPLEVGDWVQVWAQVEETKDKDGDVRVRAYARCGDWATAYARPDAIVRPSAGQAPPWVKPAQEPGGRYAMVLAGAFAYSRFNAGGKWLGSDGHWQTWAEVVDRAVDKQPTVLLSDAEGGAS